MNENIDTNPSGQLRIVVDAGDGCMTTPRVADALDELRAALEEATPEVAGFDLGNFEIQDFRKVSSFSWGVSNPPSLVGHVSGVGLVGHVSGVGIASTKPASPGT